MQDRRMARLCARADCCRACPLPLSPPHPCSGAARRRRGPCRSRRCDLDCAVGWAAGREGSAIRGERGAEAGITRRMLALQKTRASPVASIVAAGAEWGWVARGSVFADWNWVWGAMEGEEGEKRREESTLTLARGVDNHTRATSPPRGIQVITGDPRIFPTAHLPSITPQTAAPDRSDRSRPRSPTRGGGGCVAIVLDFFGF